MNRQKMLMICAETASEAEFTFRSHTSGGATRWNTMTPEARVHYAAWVELVLQGKAVIAPEQEMAAAVVLAAARRIGLTITQGTTRDDAIIIAVTRYFGVAPGDITGKRRLKRISYIRHVGMFIAHAVGRSYPETGRMFGNRDHTTAMSAFQKITGILADPGHVDHQACTADVAALRAAMNLEEPPAPPQSGTGQAAPPGDEAEAKNAA